MKPVSYTHLILVWRRPALKIKNQERRDYNDGRTQTAILRGHAQVSEAVFGGRCHKMCIRDRRCMAQNGTKLVVEAYDMDKLENEYVASAAEKVQQIAHAAGLQSTSLVWNTAYKGIDDWQLALRQEEVKENAA